MHDLGFFRANLDSIAQRLTARGFSLDVAALRSLDQERRSALTSSETLKAERNAATMEIGKLKREGADTTEQQKKVRETGDRIAALDEQAKAVDERFRDALAGIPNLPHDSVPAGKSVDDNVE